MAKSATVEMEDERVEFEKKTEPLRLSTNEKQHIT